MTHRLWDILVNGRPSNWYYITIGGLGLPRRSMIMYLDVTSVSKWCLFQKNLQKNSSPMKVLLHPGKILPDFITGLPEAQGYDALFVTCCCYTKQAHIIPTHSTVTAWGLATLFRDNVWKLYGLPEMALSDRGPQFTAEFMRELNNILGIQTKLSTAYHPQTDGQTKRLNQDIEQYLRLLVSQRQND